MHIAFNAIALRPGGGLTVLRGLVRSIRESRPSWRITAFTACDETRQSLDETRCVDSIQAITGLTNTLKSIVWQNTQLDKRVSAIGADVLLTFNHYVRSRCCPQVVYHLNLRRFCKAYRTWRPQEMLKEIARDWLARQALIRANANVFESIYLKEQAEKTIERSPRNAEVIYIGLPEELLEYKEYETEVDVFEDRLVTITSPTPHKDNPTLVRALAEIVQREPDKNWRLDVAGGINAADWKPTKQLAQRLGVAERITWHGFCDHEQLTTLLKTALCLISTSQLESFAMVPLEAMARGCPVVVANCTSMPESVGPAGLLADAGDADQFANAILQIRNNPEQRQLFVEAGREWIQRFRWSECGQQFANTIERVVNR